MYGNRRLYFSRVRFILECTTAKIEATSLEIKSEVSRETEGLALEVPGARHPRRQRAELARKIPKEASP